MSHVAVAQKGSSNEIAVQKTLRRERWTGAKRMKLPCLFYLVPFVVYLVFHRMAMSGLLIAFQQYPVNTIIISVLVLLLGANVIIKRFGKVTMKSASAIGLGGLRWRLARFIGRKKVWSTFLLSFFEVGDDTKVIAEVRVR